MKAAAGLLTGTHDFKSFCGNKKMKKSTVRTIEKIELSSQEAACIFILQEMDFYSRWYVSLLAR